MKIKNEKINGLSPEQNSYMEMGDIFFRTATTNKWQLEPWRVELLSNLYEVLYAQVAGSWDTNPGDESPHKLYNYLFNFIN